MGENKYTSCGFEMSIKYAYGDDKKIKIFIVVRIKEFCI